MHERLRQVQAVYMVNGRWLGSVKHNKMSGFAKEVAGAKLSVSEL